MAYQPYLIANYSTGIDKSLQPWLLPDDAQEELLDGYVYRGTMSKRAGYNYFAKGEQGGTPYTESRIVHNISAVNMVGVINSSNKVFTLAATGPIARGTFVVTGSNPAQSFTDNGLGYFVLPSINISAITNANPAQVTTSVNHGYTTGDQVFISGVTGMIRINSGTPYTITVTGANTFTVNGFNSLTDPAYSGGGTVKKSIGTINYTTGAVSITLSAAPTSGTVTATYNFYPGDPVMMIANYVTNDNTKQLIVADTQYINRYNATTNRLDDISPAYLFTGDKSNFFSWTNYPDASDDPRLLFTNNVEVIQNYNAATVAPYAYVSSEFTTLSALLIFQFKDRLICLRTTENGTVFPQRIRITGLGANADVFDQENGSGDPTGAGVIDIPDGTWIMGAAFNRDDLVIFTQASTWVLKYTNDDSIPFIIDKIDESRGSDAPFGAITYLNRTSAVSRRGLIISDGYRVERQDELIPDFSYNEVEQNNFNLCFAGSVDADRDHYLIYPDADQPSDVHSTRILVTNYDEDNYSIYRLPLSCMGNYITSFGVTWDDLLVYPNWDAFAAVYGNWNSFSYSKGTPFSVGGGHHGEIWKLNQTEAEDNPVKIRNMVVIDQNTIQITTDFNNYSDNPTDDSLDADTIYITGVSGMVEVNSQQYPIIPGSIIDNYTFSVFVNNANANLFSAFTTDSVGVAQRVIPFSSTFKKFNPYAQQDKKVRCGWLYMYVDTTGTGLTRNVEIINISNSAVGGNAIVTTGMNHNFNDSSQVTIFGVGGMTEVNNQTYFITVLSPATFQLNGVDSTGFGVYTSGGYAAVAEPAKIQIEIITNDDQTNTQLDDNTDYPYQGNCTNLSFENGRKKWYKVFINQTGRFIQFRLTNIQAGATINIQATMPGFQPVGRLI